MFTHTWRYTYMQRGKCNVKFKHLHYPWLASLLVQRGEMQFPMHLTICEV